MRQNTEQLLEQKREQKTLTITFQKLMQKIRI